MNEIDKERLKLPLYLKHLPIDGRSIPIQAYYDHSSKQWRTWVVLKGVLQELKIADLVDGMYFSSSPVSPDYDYRLPFAEVIFKYFCTDNLVIRLRQASDDLINMLGHLEKYFILLNHAKQFKSQGASTLVRIELEGLFGVHRSFYDVLQKIIYTVYERYSEHKDPLPKKPSFDKVAQQEPEELARKYHFPEPLLLFYQNKKALFFEAISKLI